MARNKFPMRLFNQSSDYCDEYFTELCRAWRSLDRVQIDRAASLLNATYENGGTVYTCGNGGSAAIAAHFHCDHAKGVRTGTDLSPRVMSLVSNIELVTAIANDLGYENIFVHQLESNATSKDVLVTISSSGKSPNIVEALRWARDHYLQTIAFTGFDGGECIELAEISIHVHSMNYGVVEDIHQAVMHGLAQYIRQSRMTVQDVTKSLF